MVSRVKELEAQLEHTEQQLRLLQKSAASWSRDMNLAEAFQGVVSLVVEFMDCDSCLLYLLEKKELVLCASNNPRPGYHRQCAPEAGRRAHRPGGSRAPAVSISREAYLDPRFKHFSDLPEDNYEAFLSAPVILRNRVAGVINVQHREPHFHTGGEMELLTTVGEQVGCLVALSAADLSALESGNIADLVMAPARRT